MQVELRKRKRKEFYLSSNGGSASGQTPRRSSWGAFSLLVRAPRESKVSQKSFRAKVLRFVISIFSSVSSVLVSNLIPRPVYLARSGSCLKKHCRQQKKTGVER